MNFDRLRKFTPQLMEIAQEHEIVKIYVFGSIARGKSTRHSDVEFLVEMQRGASLFGVAGFPYEAEQLLGIAVDVTPLPTLPMIKDREFVKNIQAEAVQL